MHKRVWRFLDNINRAAVSILKSNELLVHSEIERIRGGVRYKDKKSLIPYGSKVYSQNDEDGIINEIFLRIGTTNKKFVELGVGNGLENNTCALLCCGWTGLWIDASKKLVKAINDGLGSSLDRCGLKVIESFITKDNVDSLISGGVGFGEIDLMSIDIDGNDYHVFKEIACVNPRVVVIEYNAKFAPPISFCIDYNKNHAWCGGDYFGASLKFLEKNMTGYCLVGCNITGVNAFFVRNDLVADKFLGPFTAESHYEPARYYLCAYSSGHLVTYDGLRQSIINRCDYTGN